MVTLREEFNSIRPLPVDSKLMQLVAVATRRTDRLLWYARAARGGEDLGWYRRGSFRMSCVNTVGSSNSANQLRKGIEICQFVLPSITAQCSIVLE